MKINNAINILNRDLAIQKEYKALPDGIQAMETAIKSLEAWEKVINTLKNWSDAKVSPKQRDVYFDCIELIEQTMKQEVTDK